MASVATRPPRQRRGPEPAPPMTTREFLRFAWTQLTAMRTALVLLFALIVAAIPGSLGPRVLPQRPNNPVLVREFLDTHPTLGPILDRLGFFDVYGAPWFAAIYLLLMVSMVGCIVPRIVVYARNVRAMPSGAPRRLDRLPEHVAGETGRAASEALDAGQAWLLARRYRVRRQGGELSGERGYAREFGNLLFHVSILGVLAGVAVSTLAGFKGSVIVTEGAAFSNNLSQYDDFTAGGLFDRSALAPFTVWVDRFDVEFERGPVQRGAARQFLVHARVAEGAAAPTEAKLEVNTPLVTRSAMVNLIGHGYAPVVTITDARGATAFSGPVVFLPQDSNFTSLGVIKAPDARPQRLAVEGILIPSQSRAGGTGPLSTFPAPDNPALWGTLWQGAPRVETGRPENVYSLDTSGLTQVMDGAVPASFRLAVGETYTLPDGSRVTFEGLRRWAKLQVSDTPGLPLVWASVALGVLGLLLSMFSKPRRVFARVTDAAGAPPLVEVGGLDRVDARTGLAEEVAGLAAALGVRDAVAVHEAASGAEGASGDDEAGSGREEHT